MLAAFLLTCTAPAHSQALDAPADYAVPSFDGATLRWNWEARDLVRRSRSDPLWAARSYALVSLAQLDAALEASAGPQVNREAIVDLAVAAASALTLAHLFPHDAPRVSAIYGAHLQSIPGIVTAEERARARLIGERAAMSILKQREGDGAISLDAAPPPARDDGWFSSEGWPPQRTYWGQVRPFLIKSIADFDLPEPPQSGSEAFSSALLEVRAARQTQPARNDELAKKWADGPGTATPPGRWNKIAAALIADGVSDEVASARILAFLNMALMDASITCWRVKFQHWLLRPSQADQRIVTTYPLPNFPAYPSGHATFSAAGGGFLSAMFPKHAQQLGKMVEEAAQSRVAAGIHYPFDATAGLSQGRQVARLAVERYRAASIAGGAFSMKSLPSTGAKGNR